MATRDQDIKYCTNCRRTAHVSRESLGHGQYLFKCQNCGATLYPFGSLPPTNADDEKRRKPTDLIP